MSATERFKFNAKPGEPGFKEVGKNKYGHTVLNQNSKTSSMDDKVDFSVDPETGLPRADVSIWDTQEMKDLANKLNLPLDKEESAEPETIVESPKESTNMVTDKDMDDLLENIQKDLVTQKQEPDNITQTVSEPVFSKREDNLQQNEERIRKVSLNSIDVPSNIGLADVHTKTCSDHDCDAILPANAKFCSTCGKLQKVNSFCIECGHKFNDREKFCPSCGCARE